MYKKIPSNKVIFLIIISAGFILFSPLISFGEWAYVKYVIDGDTFILSNNEHIRLIGINAPEIKSKYHSKTEFFAKEAKYYLKSKIEHKRVWLKGYDNQKEFDKYGRRLAYVYLKDGTFINEELIRLGYAEAIRHFPYKYKELFLMLEGNAKKRHLGMWGATVTKGGKDER